MWNARDVPFATLFSIERLFLLLVLGIGEKSWLRQRTACMVFSGIWEA
jgi:hypothetical protein